MEEEKNIMQETSNDLVNPIEEQAEEAACEVLTQENAHEVQTEKADEERDKEVTDEERNEAMRALVERIASSLSADNRLEQSEKPVAVELLTQLVGAVAGGSLDTASLQWLRNAINYDRDLAQASRDGEVKGRNARIDELLKQIRQTTDIHQLGSTANIYRTPLPQHVIGGLSAADRQTIWERGREKRVRH